MNRRFTFCFATSLASTVLLAGCASAPDAGAPQTASTLAAAPGCDQLGAEIARTEATRQAAAEKGQNAWKAVVPFAVVARYASGKAAVNDANRQLDALHTEFDRQGCPRHGN